jgi:carbamoyl-phosphate synthase/aspartate carbamoyltransferase/dihydroorotase
MITLPGLIDIHVHLREPGESYKEDFYTGTSAALAGGITTVLAMPNTKPPILDQESFAEALKLAEEKACCDYGIYLGGAADNAERAAAVAAQAAGLKLYLDATYGPLLLESLSSWMEHFKGWPRSRPLVAHAEEKTLAAYLALGAIYGRPVHICHVSRKVEVELIREAKRQGIKVTCEVTPHHLFLTAEDERSLPPGRGRVSPPLGTVDDQQALWDNLQFIDCIATDHAPHTLQEKDGQDPPPGFPGLETALPLLITAVREGRLEVEDIIAKMFTNPRRIFSLPEQQDTRVEIDETHRYQIRGESIFSKARWTPFEGRQVYGLVTRVVLRGKTVYQDGEVLAEPGTGRNVRSGDSG